MPSLPTVFELCRPRPEVLSGDLPDSIFAADLWDVIEHRAHQDYLDPSRFFANSYPTENLARLLKEVGERLAGAEGGTPVFRLETGFGGGKTHSLIAAVHLAREGTRLGEVFSAYGVERLPAPGETRIAAFVGDQSDPRAGLVRQDAGESFRTYTPWGELAYRVGGWAAYNEVRENDENGGAPTRDALERAFGDEPVLVLMDELGLYIARALALPEDHPRHAVVSQLPVFMQSLFTLAAQRPRTAVIFTLPTEQDANRVATAHLRALIPQILGAVSEMSKTAGRQVPILTPTQSFERASVLGRRLFQSVERSRSAEIAEAYQEYYEAQRHAGAEIDNRAFEREYRLQLETGYPFHPELIRLFSERLAEISEFQATRGALRLVARLIRSVWDNRATYPNTLLLHPFHLDLTRPELQDELVARLGRGAFRPALESDVVRAEGGAHAALVEEGWPVRAATEAAITVFLHSLPDGSRGLNAGEVALAVGRPGYDLAYVKRGLEETERNGWYMHREGDRFLFRTRASVNKRFQERSRQVTPAEIREQLDLWIEDMFQGFESLQTIAFPQDQTAISDTPERVRLAIIHYDTEVGYVGHGDRLDFTKRLFLSKGADALPRLYKNNLVFLLAEGSRVEGLKETVRALIGWERVRNDLEQEQRNLAATVGEDHHRLQQRAQRGETGVPPEFMALQNDIGAVMEKLGPQELAVRTRLLEAYRVLAFPAGSSHDALGELFSVGGARPVLECYRVDFGEATQPGSGRRGGHGRTAVAEGPILETLRQNNKLVQAPLPEIPVALAPAILRQPPLWQPGERKVATAEMWDRLRRNPELPILLRPTDLLPTLRAGLTTTPDPLWYYYDEGEKRVYTHETASELTPVLSQSQFVYEIRAAVQDNIMPVHQVSARQVWDHLWPREGGERVAKFSLDRLPNAARASILFPVMPSREVLWRALEEGTRENRWILYIPSTVQAIGAQQMEQWPGMPRLEPGVELWQYQAALDANIYPPRGAREPRTELLIPAALKQHCWPAGADEMTTEDLERFARGVWRDLSRPQLEQALREGVRGGQWGAWYKGNPEMFYRSGDLPGPGIAVGSEWSLVSPESALAGELESLRPGRGPQPVTAVGTPREALTSIWDQLRAFRNIELAELLLTADDRAAFDNTLVATWPDRPPAARAEVTVAAEGQRQIEGQRETLRVDYFGRFDDVRALLTPIWPFGRTGQLSLQLTLALRFDPPAPLDDARLEAYRNALVNANQGQIEVRAVPLRRNPRRGR